MWEWCGFCVVFSLGCCLCTWVLPDWVCVLFWVWVLLGDFAGDFAGFVFFWGFDFCSFGCVFVAV